MSRQETALLRIDDVSGDPWGTTIGHAFNVAEALHHREYASYRNMAQAMNALDRWQFRHSPIADDDTCSALEEWPCSEYRQWPTPKLIRTFRILNRYLDVLKRAGKDY